MCTFAFECIGDSQYVALTNSLCHDCGEHLGRNHPCDDKPILYNPEILPIRYILSPCGHKSPAMMSVADQSARDSHAPFISLHWLKPCGCSWIHRDQWQGNCFTGMHHNGKLDNKGPFQLHCLTWAKNIIKPDAAISSSIHLVFSK